MADYATQGSGPYDSTGTTFGGNVPKETTVYDHLSRTTTVLRGCHEALENLYGRPTQAPEPQQTGPMGVREQAVEVEALAEKLQARLHEIKAQIGTL